MPSSSNKRTGSATANSTSDWPEVRLRAILRLVTRYSSASLGANGYRTNNKTRLGSSRGRRIGGSNPPQPTSRGRFVPHHRPHPRNGWIRAHLLPGHPAGVIDADGTGPDRGA